MICGGVFICDKVGSTIFRVARYQDGIGVVRSGAGMMLVGSDRTNESSCEDFSVETVAMVPDLRFAIVATPDNRDEIQSRMRNAEPFEVITEYPRTAQAYLGGTIQRAANGKSEGLLRYYELSGKTGAAAVAGFFLVRTGRALAMNQLEIVEDYIEPVVLNRLMLVSETLLRARNEFDTELPQLCIGSNSYSLTRTSV